MNSEEKLTRATENFSSVKQQPPPPSAVKIQAYVAKSANQIQPQRKKGQPRTPEQKKEGEGD